MAIKMMERKKGQDWINLVLAIRLFISPWIIGFAAEANPAWNAWIAGIVSAPGSRHASGIRRMGRVGEPRRRALAYRFALAARLCRELHAMGTDAVSACWWSRHRPGQSGTTVIIRQRMRDR